MVRTQRIGTNVSSTKFSLLAAPTCDDLRTYTRAAWTSTHYEELRI